MKNYTTLLLCFFVFSLVNCQILKKPIPDKLVVLTFDDAPVSQHSIVAPLLKKHNFGATFFVCEFPTKSIDRSAYMNWEQISELNKMGFEIANHTQTHISVGTASEATFIKELNYIETKCLDFGIDKPTNFAYPAYSLSTSAMNTLKKRGYKFARAGGSRAYNPLTDQPHLIPSWATDANNKETIIDALKYAKNGSIVVLTIHGVPDIEHPWVDTPPELFEEYLNYLTKHNFKVIALRDLYDYIDLDVAMQSIDPNLKKSLKN